MSRAAVSADMRRFASDFLSLREARHHADADPGAVFTPAGSLAAIAEARAAIAAFHRAREGEQSGVLALTMVRLCDCAAFPAHRPRVILSSCIIRGDA